ncbi:uncharacterized protein [Rutidosis leptorrhynchoides]|uniref:uncharacterized protein n=1 Tax=Rutidosis leptorrhynchoides TaxID=125765 RepID=UPI003A9A021D
MRRKDRAFDMGTWVYLKLQPHRQVTLRSHNYSKLSPKFYGPFQIIERIRVVAYKLQLHSTAHIDPVFHVSQLKENKGATPVHTGHLPAINEEGLESELPVKLLEIKMLKKENISVVYGLIQWQNGSIEDAT